MKRFVCADVHPGCGRVFTGPGDQAVLDQVLAHTAADHGLPRPTMAFIERVVIATRPLTPAGEEHRHLTLVGPAPPDRSGAATGAGHRAGRRLRPVGASRLGAADPAATVTALPDRAARPHRTYRHECWLYHGDTEFQGMVVPFIADGLARDQPVMVAVPEPRLHAVRDALGGDAERVVWADMADLGANPARIIPAWQEFTEKYRGDRRPIRRDRGLRVRHLPSQLPDLQLRNAYFVLRSRDLRLHFFPLEVQRVDGRLERLLVRTGLREFRLILCDLLV